MLLSSDVAIDELATLNNAIGCASGTAGGGGSLFVERRRGLTALSAANAGGALSLAGRTCARMDSPVFSSVQPALAVDKLSLLDPRHNAFVAAATLKHYLAEMHDDLFLGLLAYNIGPRNGGLKFIMEQYGATDFVTMQPYFQELPRDYPIRVLSYALAFRLWRQDGKLPAYQEGANAVHIQQVGIPGLETVF